MVSSYYILDFKKAFYRLALFISSNIVLLWSDFCKISLYSIETASSLTDSYVGVLAKLY